MNREQVLQWAREASFIPTVPSNPKNRTWIADDHEVEHFARLVRAAALDEAKSLSDQHAKHWWTIHCATNKHMETTRKAHDEFCRLSGAIDALKCSAPSS